MLDMARLHDRGYARLEDRGRAVMGHRVAYRLFLGKIPAGHDVVHRFHTCARSCTNPEHLVRSPGPSVTGANRERAAESRL